MAERTPSDSDSSEGAKDPSPKRRSRRSPEPESPQIRTACSVVSPSLDEHFAGTDPDGWKLVAESDWSESMYHSGHIAYHVQRNAAGAWVMRSIARDPCLDDVTEEDVEEGALTDEQFEALGDMTLEEARAEEERKVVAVWLNPPKRSSRKAAATLLYDAVVAAGGMDIMMGGDED